MKSVILFLLCAVRTAAVFDHGTVLSNVRSDKLDEISGVAASRRHAGILYVIMDHGDDNSLYALNATTGKKEGDYKIKGADNCDWEDIAIGPGPTPGVSYIYIGDIGGNADKSCQAVYRIEEPANVTKDADVDVHGQFRYSWPEENCETLLVSPKDASLYLVTKSKPGSTVKVYRVPDTAWDAEDTIPLSDSSVVNIVLEKDLAGPVAGDISPDGQHILLKTYQNIYLYTQGTTGENIGATLTGTPERLYYQVEEHGESVCWDPQGEGFYTISEGKEPDIWYYERSDDDVVTDPMTTGTDGVLVDPTNTGTLNKSCWRFIAAMLGTGYLVL